MRKRFFSIIILSCVFWNMMLINNTYFNNKIELINEKHFLCLTDIVIQWTLDISATFLQYWIYISRCYCNVANQHFWDIDFPTYVSVLYGGCVTRSVLFFVSIKYKYVEFLLWWRSFHNVINLLSRLHLLEIVLENLERHAVYQSSVFDDFNIQLLNCSKLTVLGFLKAIYLMQ